MKIISKIFDAYKLNGFIYVLGAVKLQFGRQLKILASKRYVLKAKKSGRNFIITKPYNFTDVRKMIIGNNVEIMKGARIDVIPIFKNQTFEPLLTIEDNVSINPRVHIACINKINIGANSLLASNVFITDHFHGETDAQTVFKLPPGDRPLFSPGSVNIGEACWIGENVSILPNVSLGASCIVGANSVVTKSFPSGTILAGNPAKEIRRLILNDL